MVKTFKVEYCTILFLIDYKVGNLQYIKTDYAQSVQTAPPCSYMRFKPLPVENQIKFIAFQHFPDLLDFFGHQHDFCIL